MAAGQLADVVQPWDPWWTSTAAARLELGAGGTPLVAAAEGPLASADPDAPAAPDSGLPAPPSRPLPPLSALTKALPSPLLRYQLLDLLYCYCYTLRLYNGDYAWEAAAAADVLFALSAVLAAAPSAPSSSAAGGDDSAACMLLGCVQRACQPPVGSRDSRGLAIGVLADVAAVLQLGRAVVLTALMDTSRLVEAARQQLEEGSGGSSSRSRQVGIRWTVCLRGAAGGCWTGCGGCYAAPAGHPPPPLPAQPLQEQKELRRLLVAAERKLLFFLSWANEQPGELYELLALAAAAEAQKHSQALGSHPAGAAGGADGLAAQLGATSLGSGRAAAQPEQPQGQAAAVLIEEL